MKTERRSADVLLSAAMALVFGLIFYTFNTPLGPSIGSDNAMYLTLGTALARGYAPYTQIFDHKGPMLYLLQMLPQLLSGGYSTLAVFIQQVIALFLCLRVVSRIARTLGAYSGVTQLFYLALIASLVGGGNLTEEYASLPTLLGAYAALRVFLRPDWTKRLFAPALLMGVCTMAAFLLRANNALPLAALTLALALCLLAKKQFAPLGQCAAGFAAGLALCALPVVIWLAARGRAPCRVVRRHRPQHALHRNGQHRARRHAAAQPIWAGGHADGGACLSGRAGAAKKKPDAGAGHGRGGGGGRAGSLPFPQVLRSLPDSRRADGGAGAGGGARRDSKAGACAPSARLC